MLSDIFHNLTEIFAVMATLIGLMVVRANQLADRARSSVQEAIYEVVNIEDRRFATKRLYCLIDQGMGFIARYHACAIILSSLVLTMVLLIFAYFLLWDEVNPAVLMPLASPHGNQNVNDSFSHHSGELLLWAAFGFVIFALVFVLREFFNGRKTLMDNMLVLLEIVDKLQPHAESEVKPISKDPAYLFSNKLPFAHRLDDSVRRSLAFRNWHGWQRLQYL